MKVIDLYIFMEENNLEYHWHNRDGNEDVLLFVNTRNIEEFNKLLGSSIMDEEGINCIMKDGYFCFWMKDICEYFGIETKDIFRYESRDSLRQKK